MLTETSVSGNTEKELTALDLFCGCGGMSWGLQKAGFHILAGIDDWGPALNTFRLNHPDAVTLQADVTTLRPREVLDRLDLAEGQLDCLVGGPPCQGFSKNVPAAYRFLDDPRNHLFRNYLSFVEALRPKTVVMENVAEIYNAYGGRVRHQIMESLIELGYNVKAKVLFAPDYGIPQRRRRCIFLASRTGIAPTFPPPRFGETETITLFGKTEMYISAWSAISDLPALENGQGYEPMPYDKEPENDYQAEMRKDSNSLYDHLTRQLKSRQFSRVSSLGPGQGLRDLPAHLKTKTGYSGAYGRLDYERLAPTITRWVFHPGSGRFCHPREARLITIREAARLQSFSDDFRFTGTYIQKSHQVGNAVPPLLMYALADSIRACCRADVAKAQ